MDILILGIGNVLWADEGFGVRVVETLQQCYQFPDNVSVLDGGTQGLFLLPYVQTTRRLLILDAIDYGLAAGTFKIVLNEAVPQFMGVKKLSLHQTGFQEVLAAARLLGQYPDELVLIGVQPASLEYGEDLSPVVRAQVMPAVQLTLEQLARWDVNFQSVLGGTCDIG
ncbi:MAG: hydrogenase expression/formation protein [Beggiatoa sp. IS2]|nr:MAG: hydrogenase expression/formation protein [Beggiatoa sp. IS2]